MAGLSLFPCRLGLGFEIHLSIQQPGHPGADRFHYIPQGIGTKAGITGGHASSGMAQQGRFDRTSTTHLQISKIISFGVRTGRRILTVE